jgi:hypothetical protein
MSRIVQPSSSAPHSDRPAERELREAAGEVRMVRRGNPANENVAEGRSWRQDRIVRAEVLYELLTRPPADRPLRAVILIGIRIRSALNLEAAEMRVPLILHHCYLDDPVNLNQAQAPAISLTACHIPALAADQLDTRGNLELRRSSCGVVSLIGAHIGGQLSFSGATLTADRYPIGLGDASLYPPETRDGPADDPPETRDGPADERFALGADGLTVDGSMFCHDGFTAEGRVDLPRAHIGGLLNFDGAMLANPCGEALRADRLRVEHGMFCRDGFTAEGEVRLPRAHIGGQLSFRGASLTGAKLHNRHGPALHANGLRVDQDLSFEPSKRKGDPEPFCPFHAEGEIRLMGAHIGGQLSLDGAQLASEGGWALSADRLRVDQDMFCRKHRGRRFLARGGVSLLGARIGAQLSFAGAELRRSLSPADEPHDAAPAPRSKQSDPSAEPPRPGGAALNADGLQVDQSMFCGEGFTAAGEVRLIGAHIGGQLAFTDATLGGRRIALDLEDAKLRALGLHFAAAPHGELDLAGARVERLFDRTYGPHHEWAHCRLRGCRYDALPAEPEVSVGQRLGWLAADPGEYSPQPYEQLAGVYRRSGDDEAARRVLIAKQRRRRQEALGRPAKAWSWFLGLTVGYGYRLWLAGAWLIVLGLVGSLLFGALFDAATTGPGDLTPTKDADQVPPFQPVLYTVDVLLPVVSLGQETGWNAHGAAQWVMAGGTLSGWLLTTALVAGLVIRRG